MKRFLMTSAFLIVFLYILTACAKLSETTNNKFYFKEPNKIVIYLDGNTQTLTNEDKLFSDIVKQMNLRVQSTLSIAKLAFRNSDMDTIKKKEVVVEFVYSKNQKSKFGFVKKEYTSLIFPLTGQNKEFCFFKHNDDYSGPVSPLRNSEIILQLINKK